MGKQRQGRYEEPNETLGMGCDAILLAIYGVIQSLGTDERPEILLTASPFVLART
jgi:hypothetical protein